MGDLIRVGIAPKALYTTEGYFILLQKQLNGLTIRTIESSIYMVTAEELQRVSFLQHPQQVLGLFSLPKPTMKPPQKGRLYLALDGIQDPGNLGTIIRLADWFGIDTIYCSDDTADAWAPKVVQATMGSIARINVVPNRALRTFPFRWLRKLRKRNTLFRSGCNSPSRIQRPIQR